MHIKYTLAPFALLSLLVMAAPSSGQNPVPGLPSPGGAPPPPAAGGGAIPGGPPPPGTPGLAPQDEPKPVPPAPARGKLIPGAGGPPPPGTPGAPSSGELKPPPPVGGRSAPGPARALPAGGPGGGAGYAAPGGITPELTPEERLARDTEIEVLKAHLAAVKADLSALEQAGTGGGEEESQKLAAKVKALKAFGERLEGNIRKLERPAPNGNKAGNKRDPRQGYHPVQATGEPDAGESGAGSPLAWSPFPSDHQREWLGLIYENTVELAEIRIHNINTTGALSKITGCVRGPRKSGESGVDQLIWEDREPVEKTPAVRVITVAPGIRANAIRLEFDIPRAKKYQQIDAVELVGRDGSRQWARSSEASSNYNAPGGLGN